MPLHKNKLFNLVKAYKYHKFKRIKTLNFYFFTTGLEAVAMRSKSAESAQVCSLLSEIVYLS